jgi:hypothetical protein
MATWQSPNPTNAWGDIETTRFLSEAWSRLTPDAPDSGYTFLAVRQLNLLAVGTAPMLAGQSVGTLFIPTACILRTRAGLLGAAQITVGTNAALNNVLSATATATSANGLVFASPNPAAAIDISVPMYASCNTPGTASTAATGDVYLWGILVT